MRALLRPGGRQQELAPRKTNDPYTARISHGGRSPVNSTHRSRMTAKASGYKQAHVSARSKERGTVSALQKQFQNFGEFTPRMVVPDYWNQASARFDRWSLGEMGIATINATLVFAR